MKTIVVNTKLSNELKRRFHRIFRPRNRVAGFVPFSLVTRTAEHVRTCTHHRVPIRDGKPQMFSHRLGTNSLMLVVVLESKRILRVFAFVGNFFGNVRKEFIHYVHSHGIRKRIRKMRYAVGLVMNTLHIAMPVVGIELGSHHFYAFLSREEMQHLVGQLT